VYSKECPCSARAVEFHIRGVRAGTRDRGAAITVEIRDLAVRSCHAARVENVARPSPTSFVVSGEDVKLKSSPRNPTTISSRPISV
jgi:hypothetical protein